MTSSSTVDFPTLRFTTREVQTNVVGAVLVNQAAFTPAYLILEGIDLVNESLTENDTASVFIEDPGSDLPNTIVLQAIVYATSQGQFSWRGSMVLYPNEILAWSAILGQWHINVWGHIEPNFLNQA